MERLDLLARLALGGLLPALVTIAAAPALATSPALATTPPPSQPALRGSAPAADEDLLPWARPGSLFPDPTWDAAQPGPLFAGPSWVASPRPASGPSPTGPSSELQPSGLTLAGGAGVTGLAVDGTGAVWVDGPWEVARFDPATGAAEVWDAADDLAFGQVTSLVGSASAGVWLVEGDRVRLFDGQRFVVDLAVPAEYRGGAEIGAMAEVGAEVWVGGRAGVARWADGQWSSIGLGQLGEVSQMAVDADGSVWVVAQVRTGERRPSGLARFDGRDWVAAPRDGAHPRRDIDEIVADPTGGIVVRTGSAVPEVRRFDGRLWTDLTPGLVQTRVGVLADRALGVSWRGEVWAAGRGGVAVWGVDGRWRPVVSPAAGSGQGARAARALVVSGDQVLLADDRSLSRVVGDRLVPVWADPAIRPMHRVLAQGPGPGKLVATSADEAWHQQYGWYTSPTVVVRGGRWEVVRPPNEGWWNGIVGGDPVLASDGAIWAISDDGLARYSRGRWTVVATDVVPTRDWTQVSTSRLFAGDAGSVWAVQPAPRRSSRARSALLRFAPDGTRREVDLPKGWLLGAAAGPDGAVWVVLGNEGNEAGLADNAAAPSSQAQVRRWTDRAGWSPVAAPPMDVARLWQAQVTGDGALWLSASDAREQGRLGRFAAGRWTAFDVTATQLWPFQRHVCTTALPTSREWSAPARPTAIDLTCIGLEGPAPPIPLGVRATSVSLAPDGTVWVLGEQLARLPGPRPEW